MGLHETGEDPIKERQFLLKGSNRVGLLSARRGSGVAKGGRILERRSGDLKWMARPAKGNPTSVVANGAEVNWR